MSSLAMKTDEARERLDDLVTKVAEGSPQVLRNNFGTEAVLVSKQYFEKAESLIKSRLLSGGYAGEEESDLERELKNVRSQPTPSTSGRKHSGG